MLGPFQLLFWVALLLWLGEIGAPLGRKIFPDARDRGTGAGRVAALWLWMVLFWLPSTLTPLPPSTGSAVLSLGALFALSVWLRRRERGGTAEVARGRSAHAENGVFLGLMVACLWVRSWAGDIWDNEKFMDGMILQSLLVSPGFPPEDRWMAGYPLNYHFLGQMLFVPLTKICAIPMEYAYNLALASVLPLASGCATTLVSHLRRSVRAGLLAGTGLAFAGTFATPYFLVSGDEPFHWMRTGWWVIRYTINEYPAESFLVGDLHAHFASLPVTILAAGALLTWLFGPSKQALLPGAAAGALLGSHYGLNGWAIPPLAALAGTGALIRILRGDGRGGGGREWGLSAAAFLGCAFALAFPFGRHYSAPPTFLRVVTAEWRSHPGEFALHWGALLLPLLLLAFGSLRGAALRWRLAAAAGVAVLAAAHSVTAGALLLTLMGFLRSARGRPEREELSLVAAALGILVGCEWLYIHEEYAFHQPYPRANTVFKFHYAAWCFLFLALPALWARLSRAGKAACGTAFALAGLFFPAALLTRTTTAFATLDGAIWMKVLEPGEARAVAWLRSEVPPGTRIVEAVPPEEAIAAREGYSRLSSFSGRPAVLGWFKHEGIWRPGRAAEITERIADIREIYATADPARLRNLAAKYGVRLIALGRLERKAYPGAEFKALQTLPAAFQAEGITIFEAN